MKNWPRDASHFESCGIPIAAMGIDPLWPRIYKAEGDEYIESKVPSQVHTAFVDGQVMLMKSTIPQSGIIKTWEDFVNYNFTAKLHRLHASFKNVILSFDNYEQVPIFKTLEQLKRSAASRKNFDFSSGDKIPDKPPHPDVWSHALQNRNYKTVVISIICKLLAASYKPPALPKKLVLDFVNVVEITFSHYDTKRTVMQGLAPLGESDIKWMRFVPLFGPTLVDSIDSDCILIAFMFMQKHNWELDVYIRRMASRSIEDDKQESSKRKRGEKRSGSIQYEIINIKKLLSLLHISARQSVGSNFCVPDFKMTNMLVFLQLLSGSDFSRKIPQLGATFLWEHLHVSVPLITMCSSDEENFEVNEDLCVDTLFVELYRTKYCKHVAEDSNTWDSVYQDLQQSKLNDKTKLQLPDRDMLRCIIRNIKFIMHYWNITNGSPPSDLCGKFGYVMQNGKLAFGLHTN